MLEENDLFLASLEQIREIISSPEISSRAQNVFLAQTVSELYELIDEYAKMVSPGKSTPDHSFAANDLLIEVREKLVLIQEHTDKNLKMFNFLSEIAPKT
jgi:hypothetical protein